MRRGKLIRAGLCLAAIGALLLGERALDRLWPYPALRLTGYGFSRELRARDGTLLRLVPNAAGERSIRLPGGEFSAHLRAALLAAEDRRFLSHSGVDPAALLRAAGTSLRAGRVVSGASTLTMQLARIVEPRPRTLCSKLLEMLRARQIERIFTKEEILTFYLNMAPLGGMLRGFEAGSLYWFGRRARDLTPAQAAALVAMLPAPSRRSPDGRAELLAAHRNRVLEAMAGRGALGREELARALAEPLDAAAHPWPFLAPHFCDFILARGAAGRTSLDLDLQRRVEKVVAAFPSEGVDGLGIVVLDRSDGAVAALLGSRGWRSQPLDATRCRRAAGSSLKPFLFALAFQAGAAGPESLLLDTPGRFGDYSPENFSRDYVGPILAGQALQRSRNLPAVRLLGSLGVESFRDLLRRLGLPAGSGPLHLDLALGTLAVSPRELARAWHILADRPEAAGLLPATREHVLAALAACSPGRGLAWKTGTSSGRRDAWCAGVTPEHILVVWLGNLDGRGAPGLVGGEGAARLFAALAGALDAGGERTARLTEMERP